MHVNSQLMFEKYVRQYFRPNVRVLEIAPDAVPSTFCRTVGDPSIRWESLNLADGPALFQSDGLNYLTNDPYRFPVEDDSFDVVFSAQVIEHVAKIWTWMRELTRVCKPGGVVITINPAEIPFHEWPIDCWRIYPDGMRALHEEVGLRTELAEFGSLQRTPSSLYMSLYWLKQMVKPLYGRKRHDYFRFIDTVSVGRKPGR